MKNNFFASHLIEHRARQTALQPSVIKKCVNMVQVYGNITYGDAIKYICSQVSIKDLNNLAKDLKEVENEEDDGEKSEKADEGRVNYHNYKDMTTQNPFAELSDLGNYSTFAIPAGIPLSFEV